MLYGSGFIKSILLGKGSAGEVTKRVIGVDMTECSIYTHSSRTIMGTVSCN